MQQYAEPVITENPLSSVKQIIVSEKYILPYYYEHMNKNINTPNKPLAIKSDNNQEKHIIDYLLEVAERGEITNDFKEHFINYKENENKYTIVDMNPNKSFSYKFKSLVQQLWALNE